MVPRTMIPTQVPTVWAHAPSTLGSFLWLGRAVAQRLGDNPRRSGEPPDDAGGAMTAHLHPHYPPRSAPLTSSAHDGSVPLTDPSSLPVPLVGRLRCAVPLCRPGGTASDGAVGRPRPEPSRWQRCRGRAVGGRAGMEECQQFGRAVANVLVRLIRREAGGLPSATHIRHGLESTKK